MKKNRNPFVHESVILEGTPSIGVGTKIWHQTQIANGVQVGKDCIIGKGVFIDKFVIIGDRVKIQNYVCIYRTSVVENEVFIGPHSVITNDRYPRASTPSGKLKTEGDWIPGKTIIKLGSSLGAGTIILPNLTLGSYCMIGAGSVITQDVKPHEIIVGNPGRLVGYICVCGRKKTKSLPNHFPFTCPACGL